MPFLLCAVLAAAPAQARPSCSEHSAAIKVLSDNYQEAPVALGVTNVGGLVEVYASKDGATWTILVTSPDGMACLVAAGEGWKAMDFSGLEPEA